MDATGIRAVLLTAALTSLGASYRTENFIVTAPTSDAAEKIGRAAEQYRRQLAIEWLGHEMRAWRQPCPITAHVGDQLGAGGATSFLFEQGQVFGWQMTIQGSLVRILDSVLPHEITHTVFATHFRQPLPRWADEGACTTVEHASERAKQQTMLIDFLRTNRGIAFSRMFAMKEYPHDVMPLYSQGYSLARYLIAQGGRRQFLDFVADGLKDENWTRAINKHYGYSDLATLQNSWLDWVRKGSPALDTPPRGPELASTTALAKADRRERPEPNLIYRAQGHEVKPASHARSTPARQAQPSETKSETKVVSTSQAGSKLGWHPPKRSRLGASLAAAPVENSSTADNANPDAGRATASGSAPYQVTHPQPTQGPRQTILEWSRPETVERPKESGYVK